MKADMVIVSAGARPNLKLAGKFGLTAHPRHGIWVNEYLRTEDKDAFAIGDCAAKYNFFTGEFTDVMLASTAMAEGRLVGANLFEIKVMRKFIGILGFFSNENWRRCLWRKRAYRSESEGNELGLCGRRIRDHVFRHDSEQNDR